MDFNIDWSTIISNIISGVLGYIACRVTISKPKRLDVLETQLNRIYLPLFKTIEPNLFKPISISTAKSYIDIFNSIKSNYFEFIDAELCNLFFIFERSYISNKLDLSTYYEICTRLDTLFERTRRKLYLPVRNFAYKINRHQFPKSFIASAKYILKNILVFAVILLLALLFSYFSSILSFIFQNIISFFHQ